MSYEVGIHEGVGLFCVCMRSLVGRKKKPRVSRRTAFSRITLDFILKERMFLYGVLPILLLVVPCTASYIVKLILCLLLRLKLLDELVLYIHRNEFVA